MTEAICLAPLPYMEAAVPVVASLGVQTKIGVGWSLIALSLTTIALTYRPGRTVAFTRRAGTIVIHTSGGTRFGSPSAALPDITRHLANGLSEVTCELCGRPGRLHQIPAPVVLCDGCAFLVQGRGRRLPFQPRLPLVQNAADAGAELHEVPGTECVPAGWSVLVLNAVQYLRGLDPRGSFRLTDLGTHLDVHFDSDANPTTLTRIRDSLANRTASFCRHCGRPLPHQTALPGTCTGCLLLDEYGAPVVHFDPNIFEP